ncbi:MAG: ribosome hibernation factor SRA [Enterobacter sp.]
MKSNRQARHILGLNCKQSL